MGVWTVPSFAFFVAPLWLVLIVADRQPACFAYTCAAGIGVVAAYRPVSTELLHQLRYYDVLWGREYGSPHAVLDTIRRYLLSPSIFGRAPSAWSIAVLCCFGLAMLYVIAQSRPREAATSALILSAVAGFFLTCLWLQTPLVRSTAFIVVPLLFASLYAVSIPSRVARLARALVFGVTLVLAIRQLQPGPRGQFVPAEQWMELGNLVHDTFPERMTFHVNANVDFLSGYMASGYKFAPNADLDLIRAGSEVYLDTPVIDPPGGRVRGEDYLPEIIPFRIPQGRTGYQAVWFAPPHDACIVTTTLGVDAFALTDNRSGGGMPQRQRAASLVLVLKPSHRYRSAVIVTTPNSPADLRVHVENAAGKEVAPGPIRRSGNVFLVNLRDVEVRSILLTPAPPQIYLPPLREAWAYPD
jgi:hypothetical protein